MKTTEENHNTLDLMVVKKAVYSWSLRFPSQKSNEHLARISHEYFEDLQSEGVTLKQFEAAALIVRKRCRFFPLMADILEAVQQYRERPPQPQINAMQIEDVTSNHDLTPEEIKRNKERIDEILQMLAGKKSIDEAVEAVRSKTNIKEFGEKSEKSCNSHR